MTQLNLLPIGELLVFRPQDKLVQQAGIGALGMFGLTAFVAEILEKILNERLHGS